MVTRAVASSSRLRIGRGFAQVRPVSLLPYNCRSRCLSPSRCAGAVADSATQLPESTPAASVCRLAMQTPCMTSTPGKVRESSGSSIQAPSSPKPLLLHTIEVDARSVSPRSNNKKSPRLQARHNLLQQPQQKAHILRQARALQKALLGVYKGPEQQHQPQPSPPPPPVPHQKPLQRTSWPVRCKPLDSSSSLSHDCTDQMISIGQATCKLQARSL